MSKKIKSIVILDGQLDETTPDFENYIKEFVSKFQNEAYDVTHFKLRDMKVSFCTGCFTCWLKTPGLCIARDAGDVIRKAWIEADLLVFASPLEAGFVSSLIKTMVDKFLPLALPYIQIKDKEMRHFHRYEKFPAVACLFQPDKKDTKKNLQTNYNWIERLGYHVDEPMIFAATINEDVNILLNKVTTFFKTEKQVVEPMQWPKPLEYPNPSDRNINKLLIINGSLRKESNTGILAKQIKTGFERNAGKTAQIIKVNKKSSREEALEAIKTTDLILFAMPLYVHAMPGHFKLFIEQIEKEIDMKGKRLAFLIQSGFSEAHQSRWLEPYFEQLAERWDAEYAGTQIRGAIEGIQIQPKSMTKKVFQAMENIGLELSENAKFSPQLFESVAKTEHLSKTYRFILKLLQPTGLTNFYWNKMLKENKAFEKRYAQPLIESNN